FFDDLLPGNYQLQVEDANGCSWTEIIILPEALDLEVDLGPDLEVELGDSIQLKPLTNRPISSWQWTSDFFSANAPFEPVVTPTETQFVLLTVFDDNNCTATDTIRIFVDTDRDVFIPTAFSPDGIGENERFTIYAGDEVVIIQSLRIFSRWGNMVFEQENFSPNDPNLGWDGTLWGEPLNPAVFVYYAEILFTDGKSELITGDVVLLR
ncbi:MAG: gliding motility-associated C-terminal domain-containing protein, partial [Bacteroidota bacterium]